MEKPVHSLCDLFAQLGLPSDSKAVNQFIRHHTPLPNTIRLADASFWNPAQSTFLREALEENADWAEIVDQLNSMLRN